MVQTDYLKVAILHLIELKATFIYLVSNTKFMELDKSIMVGIYIVLSLYIIYRVFIKKNPFQEEYERLYNDILTSDKYKVKGQHDK